MCIYSFYLFIYKSVFFIRFIYKSVSIILDCNYTNDDKGIGYKISWTLCSLLQSHLAATSHNIMALSFSSERIWPNFTGGHDLTNQTSHINYNSFSYNNCCCGEPYVLIQIDLPKTQIKNKKISLTEVNN